MPRTLSIIYSFFFFFKILFYIFKVSSSRLLASLLFFIFFNSFFFENLIRKSLQSHGLFARDREKKSRVTWFVYLLFFKKKIFPFFFWPLKRLKWFLDSIWGKDFFKFFFWTMSFKCLCVFCCFRVKISFFMAPFSSGLLFESFVLLNQEHALGIITAFVAFVLLLIAIILLNDFI